ncbi:hypothetical protein ABH960_003103 [Bacillus sp. RC252]
MEFTLLNCVFGKADQLTEIPSKGGIYYFELQNYSGTPYGVL